jgi:hypothetical protein
MLEAVESVSGHMVEVEASVTVDSPEPPHIGEEVRKSTIWRGRVLCNGDRFSPTIITIEIAEGDVGKVAFRVF